MTNVIHRQFVQLPANEEERLINVRGSYVTQLFHCLTGIGRAKDAAVWVKLILETRAWEDRRSELGRVVSAGSIYNLVHNPAPIGLNSDYATVERLISDNAEALALWLKAIERPHGGLRNPNGNNQHQREEVKSNNVSLDLPAAPKGNARAKAVKQLWEAREDGDPEASRLWDQVTAGKLSPHKAAVEMGWRKQRTPYQELCAAWRRASEAERGQFEEYIAEWYRHESRVA
jgi:hypothetical protein